MHTMDGNVVFLCRRRKFLIHPTLFQAIKRLLGGDFTVIFTEFSKINRSSCINPAADRGLDLLSMV